MGERGFHGVVIDGVEKLGYHHWGSPEGVGLDILRVVRDADPATLRKQAQELEVVDEESKPTPLEVQALKQYADTDVSTGDLNEWYVLLRKAQGDLQSILASGYVIDNSHFPLDSLFCEWGFLVDLDEGVYEIYRGFQKERPKEGRWAGRPTQEDFDENRARLQAKLDAGDINQRQFEYFTSDAATYYAVERVASWPLDELPTDEEFLDWNQDLMAKLYPEDEDSDG